MREGRNWPRAEYLASAVNPYALHALDSTPGCELLADKLRATPRDDDEVAFLARVARERGLLHPTLLEQLAMTDEEILSKWDENCTVACNVGTYMDW